MSEFDDACRALRHWYYSEIKEWAADYDRAIESGEYADREEFLDRLHEDIDSSQLVIYTYKAKAVLFASDNEDAYEDQMGEKAPTVEAAAYMAIETDILRTLNVDINDDEVFQRKAEPCSEQS